MVILIYIIILAFCYGIYNMLCYTFMYPTAAAGHQIGKIGNSRYSPVFDNILLSGLAEKGIKKWNLKWQGEEKMETMLRCDGIQVSGTAYLLRQLLFLLCAGLITAPMLFIKAKYFFVLWSICFLLVVMELTQIYSAYQKGRQGKNSKSRMRIIEKLSKMIEYLPGILIFLLILMFFMLVYIKVFPKVSH